MRDWMIPIVLGVGLVVVAAFFGGMLVAVLRGIALP